MSAPRIEQKKVFETDGEVYCPLCTHTVHAKIQYSGRKSKVTPGQKCSHCNSSLDAGYVFAYRRAA
jgi:uncharacterized Zn finger protein (UPF0148 family)